MKYLLALITAYQRFFSPFLHQIIGVQTICRYEQSCSVYAQIVIAQKGIIQGGILAIKRIISCQPFAKTTGKFRVSN